MLAQGVTADMRATVRHGLAWLEEHFHPRPDDDWLLVPADHPTLDPLVIRALLRELRLAAATCSIIVPTSRRAGAGTRR